MITTATEEEYFIEKFKNKPITFVKRKEHKQIAKLLNEQQIEIWKNTIVNKSCVQSQGLATFLMKSADYFFKEKDFEAGENIFKAIFLWVKERCKYIDDQGQLWTGNGTYANQISSFGETIRRYVDGGTKDKFRLSIPPKQYFNLSILDAGEDFFKVAQTINYAEELYQGEALVEAYERATLNSNRIMFQREYTRLQSNPKHYVLVLKNKLLKQKGTFTFTEAKITLDYLRLQLAEGQDVQFKDLALLFYPDYKAVRPSWSSKPQVTFEYTYGIFATIIWLTQNDDCSKTIKLFINEHLKTSAWDQANHSFWVFLGQFYAFLHKDVQLQRKLICDHYESYKLVIEYFNIDVFFKTFEQNNSLFESPSEDDLKEFIWQACEHKFAKTLLSSKAIPIKINLLKCMERLNLNFTGEI